MNKYFISLSLFCISCGTHKQVSTSIHSSKDTTVKGSYNHTPKDMISIGGERTSNCGGFILDDSLFFIGVKDGKPNYDTLRKNR